MITRLLLSTVAMAAMSTVALAADLPSRRAPPVYIPPPVPVFSWTGFYVGGQIGYGFGKDNASFDVSNIAPGGLNGQTVLGYGANDINGLIGGAHVGYNYQLPGFGGIAGGGIVVGVEGDVDGSDFRATEDFGAALGAPGILFNRVRTDIQGSARGRLGFAVDRALFYATGGAAFGDLKSSYFAPGFASPLLPQDFTHSRVGYTVGGGIEYAITTQWSLRAEYRYTDFGTFTDAFNVGAAAPLAVRHHETQQRVQVGFSYKFDTPLAAPVVARY